MGEAFGRHRAATLALQGVVANLGGGIEGFFHITGFDNVVENTLVIDGKNYVVIQDVGRTSFGDYIALELS